MIFTTHSVVEGQTTLKLGGTVDGSALLTHILGCHGLTHWKTQKVGFFSHQKKQQIPSFVGSVWPLTPKKYLSYTGEYHLFLLPRTRKYIINNPTEEAINFLSQPFFWGADLNLTPKRTRWLVSNIFFKLSSPKN